MNKKLMANIALLTTALVWGGSFSAQRMGMDYLEPFSFNGIRMFLGALVLIPVILIINNKEKQNIDLIKGGLACGFVLFIATSIQQIAMLYSTAGKAGFITALYIIFVPFFAVLLKQRVTNNVKISIVMGLIGLYLLCMKGDMSMSFGDGLLLVSAFFYAMHIMVINHFSPKADCVKMSCIQFFVAGMLSIVPIFLWETPHLANVIMCKNSIIYAGVFACGLAYTLQVVGQKHTNPAAASLILSLESVFAVIVGFLILGETLAAKEILGCVFMVGATVLAQLPERKLKYKYSEQCE